MDLSAITPPFVSPKRRCVEGSRKVTRALKGPNLNVQKTWIVKGEVIAVIGALGATATTNDPFLLSFSFLARFSPSLPL